MTRPFLAASLVFLSASSAAAQTFRGPRSDVSDLGFGASVVIVGDQILVGRTGETPGLPVNPTRPGGVHVFTRAQGEWRETGTIEAEGVAIGDGFGSALSSDGSRLVVGAPQQAEEQGAVYLFERRESGWEATGRLLAADGAAGDRFGAQVLVRGDIVLAAAPLHAGGTGAVYMFRRDPAGSWSQAAVIEASDPATGSRFGTSLARDGDRLAVGASRAGGSGRVYLFERESDSAPWTEVAVLAPGEESASGFGTSVAFLGDRIVVGAPQTNGNRGAVLTFSADGSVLGVALAPDDLTQGAFFGVALAGGGEEMWAAAPIRDGGKGAVYRFGWDGATGGWSEVQQMTPEGSSFFIGFGLGLAQSGDLAVITAPGAYMFDGASYVYSPSAGGAWQLSGSLEDTRPSLAAVLGSAMECADGQAAGFSCSDVDLLAFLPVSAIGPVGGEARGIMVNDLWGWTDPASGREYAIVGRVDGTAFVDISDPRNPVYLGDLPLTEGASINIWRDIKVYDNHAFIVADGAGQHGVQILDLTQLRNVSNPPVRFEETAHYDQIASAHNIVIDEATGFAYVVGSSGGGETCGGGLHMVDIRDPKNPTFAGCFADPSTGNANTGYSHDAMCTIYHGPDAAYAGKEVCFGANETALSIADVTDKENPVPLSTAAHPNVGYTHQGWISDDHTHFFINDELDEIAGTVDRTRTIVWDVTDLDDPVMVMEYMGTTGATDHNMYVKGPYLYQSNYVSGLRIIDISDPSGLQEVAFFDTVPLGDNSPGFAGSWSNYPYFESGTIIVSSMREGLFLLKKRPDLVP